MKLRKFWLVISLLLWLHWYWLPARRPLLSPPKNLWLNRPWSHEAPTAAPEEFIFGVLMVGPYNDHGWSEAHYRPACT